MLPECAWRKLALWYGRPGKAIKRYRIIPVEKVQEASNNASTFDIN